MEWNGLGLGWDAMRKNRAERKLDGSEAHRKTAVPYSTVRHRNRNGNGIDVLVTFARGARDAEHCRAQRSLRSPANSH